MRDQEWQWFTADNPGFRYWCDGAGLSHEECMEAAQRKAIKYRTVGLAADEYLDRKAGII